jgi:hypothetical protein
MGSYLQVTVDALLMAAPWCLADRYSFRPWARCVEASNVGAGVLRRQGIDAQVLPCSIVAKAREGGNTVIGHNAESFYVFLHGHGDLPLPPFEVWCEKYFHADERMTEEEKTYPFHLAIEARYQGRRAVVDLTAGQVQVASRGAIKAPFGIVWYGEGWKVMKLKDKGSLIYGPCPYPDRIPQEAFRFQDPELRKRFEKLIQVALGCHLDPKVFQAKLGSLAQFDSTIKLEGVSDWDGHERTGT